MKRRLISSVVVVVIGLLLVLAAEAAPLQQAVLSGPYPLRSDAAQPMPLVMFGVALLALAMFVRYRRDSKRWKGHTP